MVPSENKTSALYQRKGHTLPVKWPVHGDPSPEGALDQRMGLPGFKLREHMHMHDFCRLPRLLVWWSQELHKKFSCDSDCRSPTHKKVPLQISPFLLDIISDIWNFVIVIFRLNRRFFLACNNSRNKFQKAIWYCQIHSWISKDNCLSFVSIWEGN